MALSFRSVVRAFRGAPEAPPAKNPNLAAAATFVEGARACGFTVERSERNQCFTVQTPKAKYVVGIDALPQIMHVGTLAWLSTKALKLNGRPLLISSETVTPRIRDIASNLGIEIVNLDLTVRSGDLS